MNEDFETQELIALPSVADMALAHLRLSWSLRSLAMRDPAYGATSQAMEALAKAITEASGS